MTVSTTISRVGPFTVDGSVDTFAFNFKIFDKSNVRVLYFFPLSGVSGSYALDSDFHVNVNADQNASPGGSVVITVVHTIDYEITIVRDLDFSQGPTIPNFSGFYAKNIEDRLDYITMLCQQLDEVNSRALVFPQGEPIISSVLPLLANRKNMYLAFDNAGVPVAAPPGPQGPQGVKGDTGAAGANGTGPAFIEIAKAVQSSRTNTFTLTDDNELVLAVPGAGTYALDVWLIIQCATAAAQGFAVKFNWVGAGGASSSGLISWTGVVNSTDYADTQGVRNVYAALQLTTVTNLGFGEFLQGIGTVTFNAGGTFSLQWAQHSPDASPSLLNARSRVALRKIS